MSAYIRIKGAWAELSGAPDKTLRKCLSILSPERFYNRAFIEKRWDGKVQLYNGNLFPAGLTQRVTEYLNEAGHEVKVITQQEIEPIDTSRFDEHYLEGITLWKHQVEAVHALLENQRGSIKVSTGGGKTEIAFCVARMFWEERGWRTLIVVPRKGLAAQTVERFRKYAKNDFEIGMCGDGQKSTGVITVATAQTLLGFKPRFLKRKGKGLKHIRADYMLQKLIEESEVIVSDECHHSSAAGWFDIFMTSRAVRRFGMSGTPLKDEEITDLKMIGATGPIIYATDSNEMVSEGLVAKPKILMVMSDAVSGPALATEFIIRTAKDGTQRKAKRALGYAAAYAQGVTQNVHHNAAVIRATNWLVDHGKQTLILCRRKEHFLTIKEALEDNGVQFMAVWGATETSERTRAKRALDAGRIQCVLATVIWDEGEDVPGIEALVLAEGVKVQTNVLQRIGRGMRKKKKGENVVWVVDFVPTCHPKLLEHAMKRAIAYENEGFEVRLLEKWSLRDDFSEEQLLPFMNWEG